MDDKTFREVRTPAYVFSADELKERMAFLRSRLGDEVRIVYAVKANPFLIRTLIPLVDGFEVCSPGEERICRSLHVPAEKMVLSGVNKEEENFDELIRIYGDRALYTAESENQIMMLNRIAVRAGCRIRVLLRLTGGNQFGMDETAVKKLFSEREDFPGLLFSGIQYYSGTQKKMKKIARETAELDRIFSEIREGEECRAEERACGSALPEKETALELEYGPGLPVSYFKDDRIPEDSELLENLTDQLRGMRFSGRITLEMGRYIAALCGYYCTKVMDLKHNEGAGYCITDGGIHQMNYYGQMMGMKIPHIRVIRERPEPAGEGGTENWTVCGSLCTTADVLVRDLDVQDLAVGDILVFERAGAYSVTEGISLFLSRDLPRVYMTEDGITTCERERILTEEWNYGRTDQNSGRNSAGC